MPVTAHLVVINGEQIQIPYNALWCQIIVFTDVAVYEFRVLVFRAETVDIHSYRLQDANGISQLHLTLIGIPGEHDIPRNLPFRAM